ncbi:STAS/SEC14 domain-containing protein [Mucilaginibacter sp. X5P1]|uniref:STAS/SEC14 domain-containing protein n=1 Tax=Mucilaginibacter sp. X5P1 TaxID=2723088 RepID=UPI00160EFEDB|nr:STAS/SEC14 domain-containing protein [Mucilaginibacter sp. X5P1]MBB6137293.1 hypothetical protein [Mucilaginibacter sp. X5P1]
MLQFIKDLPSHVAGVHATGEVRDEDLERVLAPLLNEQVNSQGKINFLLVLDTKVSSFTWGALWKDLKLGLKHYRQWKRIAIVTDQKGVKLFSDAFKFIIPGKSKGFPLDRLAEAVRWVSVK